MKTYLYGLLISATMLSTQRGLANDPNANVWGAATNDFQMSINPNDDQHEFKTNQTCTLLIRYRNISTNDTFWVYERTEWDPNYAFQVVSPSGKDISPDMENIPHGDSGAVRHVGPGQIIEIKFNLSKLLRFDQIGTYRITAKNKGIWSVEKHTQFRVVSNPLIITVSK